MTKFKELILIVFIALCSAANAGDAPPKKAVVIQNFARAPLGILEAELLARGYAIETIDAEKNGDDIASLDPLGPDLVIVLGGLMGAYETDAYPFLNHEIAVLKARHDREKPSLGICLGAQLMAKSLGAKVYPGKKGNEFGFKLLLLTEEGRNSPLIHLLAAWPMESHNDTFDLPEGAQWLAFTAQYKNQAFSSNKSLAVQFHPEVTEEIVMDWVRLFERQESQPTAEEFHRLKNRLHAQVQEFWRAWLDEVEN